ncbi:amidohydrolase 2 [Colletotrichum musicola]|uniref:6-methylsalicylate decarboxylase n=1 Tax=Colletotrichum musicola TaxID=2175873 RepID=A0A8H6J2K0_9PEZI|nr:amidohydrolase 2 [Colletotrichum musicola]
MLDRVDTHVHLLPPAYVAAIEAGGGDPGKFPFPEQSFEAIIKSMDKIGTSVVILSVPSPSTAVASTNEDGRKMARHINEYLAEVTTSSKAKHRFGFFGSLPDWEDVNGTLAEIDFLYKTQRLCFGVIALTSYGPRLLGDPAFKPIWEKLQTYKALLFTHPTLLEVRPRHIAGGFPQAIVEYPLSTTRTAADLVLRGTLRAYPDVDVILSHAGGALPFLTDRIMTSLLVPAVAAMAPVSMTPEEAKAEFAKFYYDVSLSNGAAQIGGLLEFANPSRVLFGSDFPFAPQQVVDSQIELHERFVATHPRGFMVSPGALRQNSLSLLIKHQQGQEIDWNFKVNTEKASRL